MLRLSQKAWNNVVIFAMLFMVYLFTVSNNLLQDGDSGKAQKQPLFPPYSVVMSMDFGVVRLDRIGQDWRVSGELLQNHLNENLEQPLPQQKTAQQKLSELLSIMETWSGLEAIPFVAQPESAPFVVSILLAGEDKKRVYQVFQQGNDVLLKLGAEWFLVENTVVNALFPRTES